MVNQNNKKLAEEWFRIADDDLAYAKVGLEEDDFYAQIAFHAQQAAEKYIKGFLILHGRNFRKTHDLVELLNQCNKINAEFKNLRAQADRLAPYAVDTRYPVHYSLFRFEHAQEAINASKEIIKFIKTNITKLSLQAANNTILRNDE